MSYQAYIAKISVSPHPNADRLQVGFVCGAQVIVGMDTQDGDLGIYFPSDGQLSKEYATANDLIARKDDQGNKVGGGYFDEKRRVKSQNFRKVKSEGFFMPLSSLAFTKFDLSKLKEGDALDALGGIPLCNKYFTKATIAAMVGTKKKLKVYADFPEHYDTTQFRFVIVPTGATIYITEKEHGTSVRYGNVLVHKPRGKWRKFWKGLFGDKKEYDSERQYVLGTRRAILPKVNEFDYKGGFYGNGDPYTIVPHKLHGKLKDDEIVYGEVVGFLQTGAPLFTQNVSELPELKKVYGENVPFSYGCVEGTSKFRVYRITQGGRELTHNEVVARCQQLGVDMVTFEEAFIYDGSRDALNARIAARLEGASALDSRHMKEGVCLRIESPEGIRIVKAKSWSFGVCEGYLKNDDQYIDMEEVA